MFLSDIPQALLRRWYVALLGLIVTAGLAYWAASITPAKYDVTVQSLLLPPSTSVPEGGNPYLSLGGLDAVGDILSQALTDAPTLETMKAAGLEDEYTVSRDANSAAPVMLITVTSDTERSAVSQSQILLDQLPVTLRALQVSVGVPSPSLITSSVVVRPERATVSHKGQTRAVVVAVAAGLALTVLGTAAVDALWLRRGRRIEGRHTATEDEVAAAPEPPRPADPVEGPADREGRTRADSTGRV